MAAVELTKDTFEQTVLKNDLVVVDFWAPWCGPCRAFGPVVEAASRKHPDIVFAKVNTEIEPQLAEHFRIHSVPTVMVFKQQVIVFQQSGALPSRELEQLIGEMRRLDMDEVRQQLAHQPRAG